MLHPRSQLIVAPIPHQTYQNMRNPQIMIRARVCISYPKVYTAFTSCISPGCHLFVKCRRRHRTAQSSFEIHRWTQTKKKHTSQKRQTLLVYIYIYICFDVGSGRRRHASQALSLNPIDPHELQINLCGIDHWREQGAEPRSDGTQRVLEWDGIRLECIIYLSIWLATQCGEMVCEWPHWNFLRHALIFVVVKNHSHLI